MARSKTLTLVTFVMVFMILQPLTVISKTSSSDVTKEMGEAWVTFKSYVIGQKNDAVKYGNDMLDKADAGLDKLETKASKASGDAKIQYEKEIAKLKKKRAEAAVKLDELEKSSEDA